ncbi:hypothetical protein EYF80_057766 [Liparis tanakae]|uniref:Uncharacterized protein n=1 Tax=Liparis tanakae TaxID=230148 RepID=A0A4Z2ET47_9TELE|nr:hypothetical protein EYF80_057766 [Liparis tanakae]
MDGPSSRYNQRPVGRPLTRRGQLAEGRTCPVAVPGEGQEGRGGVQARLLPPLFGAPANGTGPGRPYGTCEKDWGALAGWHAESPGSLPLAMKQDRARAPRPPRDRRALRMRSLMGGAQTLDEN